jgi:hypothetical protein
MLCTSGEDEGGGNCPVKPDRYNCRHEYLQEQAEQAQREAHEQGECKIGSCPYCLDELLQPPTDEEISAAVKAINNRSHGMRITNRMNLPQPLVSAIERDPYVRVGDVSVTSLAKSPRQFWLERRNADEIEEDASDRIWALLGSTGHKILERADTDNHLSEERLTVRVLGWVLSGTPDLLDGDGVLTDYKFTSVWAVKDGKPEWEQQLNTYAWLYWRYKFGIKALRIVAILRDWSKRRAQREPDYPQVGVIVREVPLWDLKRQAEYIFARVEAFQHAETIPDDDLPHCTPDERWATPEVWAVKKKGAKRATSLHKSRDAAMESIQFTNAGTYEIEHRPGENVRCESYCPVQKFCNQYREMSK